MSCRQSQDSNLVLRCEALVAVCALLILVGLVFRHILKAQARQERLVEHLKLYCLYSARLMFSDAVLFISCGHIQDSKLRFRYRQYQYAHCASLLLACMPFSLHRQDSMVDQVCIT